MHCHDKFNSYASLVAKFRRLPGPCCCLASPRWTILVSILFTLFCNFLSLFLSSILSPTLLRCASLFLHVQSPPDCLRHVRLRIGTMAPREYNSRNSPTYSENLTFSTKFPNTHCPRTEVLIVSAEHWIQFQKDTTHILNTERMNAGSLLLTSINTWLNSIEPRWWLKFTHNRFPKILYSLLHIYFSIIRRYM